jgi:serine protease Do
MPAMKAPRWLVEVTTAAGIAVSCLATGALAPLPATTDAAAAEEGTPETRRPPGFARIVQRVRPAVISVSTRIEEATLRRKPRRVGRSAGSGFFISAEGYAVTCAHVVRPQGARPLSVKVSTIDGQIYDARVIGTDPLTDLALIKVDGREDFPFVTFAERAPELGDWIIVIGSPFGLAGSVTTGIVSAEDRDIGFGPYNDFLQIGAPTTLGDSGGPAFDVEGNVIGVNTAMLRTPGEFALGVGIAFAVPADIAKAIVAELKEHGAVTRGWIGVDVEPVTQEVAERLGLKTLAGALVPEPRSGEKLRGGPVKAGDVITSVNGEAVKDSREFVRKIAALVPGTKVTLSIVRLGKGTSISVDVRKLPDRPPTREGKSPSARAEPETPNGMETSAH